MKLFELEAGGKHVIVLHQDDVEELGTHSLGRVRVIYGDKNITAIVNTTKKVLKRGEIGLYVEVWRSLESPENAEIDVEASGFPISTTYIRNRMNGMRLKYEEIREIINDTVEGNLSDVELTAFVMALENSTIDMDEALNLSRAMVETGEKLQLKRDIILDKHSIGGVPGDKTTLIVVPIIAACGFAIPKSSSRAITSAAGSADKAEVLMNIELEISEMKRIVEKTNGCITWGGSLNLAPADDILIQIEYPLSIDPLLLPSIMSKKKAVGANRLLIDLPTGRGSKIKTIGDANLLARDFIDLGCKLEIKTQCAITYGEQPIGYTIGSALEAREALEVITRRKIVSDLEDKATSIAGILLNMCNIKNGLEVAVDILRSGKAELKLREIISEQGGNPNVRPDDIPIGDNKLDIKAKRNGFVLWIDNQKIVEIARATGSPKDKGSGIVIHKKIGNKVCQDDNLFTIYSGKATKLQRAEKIIEESTVIAVGERIEMLIGEIKEESLHMKSFILER